MPERILLRVSDESILPGLFGSLILEHKRKSVDLGRVTSASGVDFVADHDITRPLGRVRRAYIKERSCFAEVDLKTTKRGAPYLQEIRSGLRQGVSPGFLVHKARIEEAADGTFETIVELFEPFEISSTSAPRSKNAAIIDSSGLRKPDVVDDDEDEDKHSMPPTDTAATAGALAAKAVAGVLAESREINKALLQTYAASTRTNTTKGRSTMKNEATALAEAENVALLKAAMSGGDVPELSLVGGRTGAKSTIRLAFTSDAPGIVGTDADASRIEVREQVTSARRILALPRLLQMLELDQRTPEWSARPDAVSVQEDAVRTDSGGTISATLKQPLRVQAAGNITLMASLVAPDFEASVLAALQEALEQRIAEEFLSGSISTSPNSTDGLLHTTGVTETEYAATAVGAVSGYWDSEDALPTRLAADRRAWVISENLYRTSRRTLIEPGANRRVVQGGLLADDSMAIRTALLPDGHAIYAEWPEVVLYRWAETHITIDMITRPGHVLLTAFGWWNWSTERPDAISILKPA